MACAVTGFQRLSLQRSAPETHGHPVLHDHSRVLKHGQLGRNSFIGEERDGERKKDPSSRTSCLCNNNEGGH